MMIIRIHASVASRFANRAWAVVWLCGLLLAGCGSPVYQSAPVDADIARETLEQVLDHWKEGGTPQALKQETPKVVVQDLDWTSGAKLLSYEVVGQPKAVNANLMAKVKLSLQDKDGNASEKTVTYVVGTSPELTVFRDMMK